ncbi:tripartite tricarboxylate transporter substrate binding protein [Aquabacterium sp. A7-Y]|uniref:Bug family tripartite tricarboxylate transporter substrate binding protein n=1 Tax=Aquabacterium sp. A7-Y TaxID=1349605 RepID=UPI00223DE3C7|nr:tripartite tricarboxylate transporter substrate binding protein [Aquabacterium sp. A7-Y]MCW7536266.1 tripartite tricarboxylate transporter substrate binding protein [Aquabacterium sp. A7-Y]
MTVPTHLNPPDGVSRRRFLKAGACASALAWPGVNLLAAPWPTRPVTLIVPFATGGGTDAFARPLSAMLTRQLGTQVITVNHGGAGGTLGATVASKAPPDGYTFLLGAVHHAIAPSVYRKLSYDIETDFVPVGLVSNVPQVVVVNPGRVPVSDLKSLVEHVRKRPGKLNYGSAGTGTSHHLAGELFKQQTRTFITHIPYRGAGPALQDLIGGQLDLMFDGLGSSASHIKSGRIRALAVAASERAPAFPDVPTTAEAGLPGYQVSTWYGLWAKRGTPADILEQVQAELGKALGTAELKKTWSELGTETPHLYGDAFGRFVHTEIARWSEVVKSAGVQLDA